MRAEREAARVERVGAPASRESAPGPGAGDPFPLERVVDEDGLVADESRVLLAGEQLLRLHRAMVLDRALDERMITLQRQGRIGFYVGAIGEEAAVLGAAAAMAPTDWIFPCYREHGAALLRGMPLAAFLCDLLGNAAAPGKGRQMPCHEAWRPARYASVSSPIGTQISHAVGAAWAARIQGEEMVPLVYFGDGATSSGEFHVGLNFAAVRHLPVIFACRNNGWAISLPTDRQTAAATVAQKAVAYGMLGVRVDGNDVVAVHAATRRARARAAAGGGPTLLDLVTYRMEGHSTSDDPRAYRAAAVVEPWRRRDPIERLRRLLLRRGLLDDAGVERVRAEVAAEIQAALAEAEARPPRPPLESLFEDVYAEPLRQQREQLAELAGAVAADPRVADPRHADA